MLKKEREGKKWHNVETQKSSWPNKIYHIVTHQNSYEGKIKIQIKKIQEPGTTRSAETALTEWGLVLVFLYPLASEHIPLLTPEQGGQKGTSCSRPTSFLTSNS